MASMVIQCKSCTGSGLFQGVSENETEAVVCDHCFGRGWLKIIGDDFNGRQIIPGVTHIRHGKSSILSLTHEHVWMTYAEFLAEHPET